MKRLLIILIVLVLVGCNLDSSTSTANMTSNNQRYFGDWVTYKGQSDVGYYLGTKFVQFICKIYNFDDILSFDIEEVERCLFLPQFSSIMNDAIQVQMILVTYCIFWGKKKLF